VHVRGSGRRERPAARARPGRVLFFFFFESASLCSSHPGLSPPPYRDAIWILVPDAGGLCLPLFCECTGVRKRRGDVRRR
jgi:hypothetical protein